MSRKVNTDDIFAAINLGGSEMEGRKQETPTKASPKASSASLGRPRSQKVQITFRVSPELLSRLDQEVSDRRTTPGTRRSQATLGPVVEELLWKALGQKK